MTKRLDELDAAPLNPLEHAVRERDRGTIDMVQRAIKHRQVLLAFQPVVQAARPDNAAFHEALIRVLDETGRVIPAKEFITQVEDTEFGRMLDCIALEKGLAELRREPGLRLSVNMSARSIGYKKWSRVLQRGLSGDPTIAERLILEITEHSAIMVPELVVSFMAELQQKGIAFALDDFGAGYTSLRYLKDFSFDVIKIDGSFVEQIDSDPDNQVLVKAMVALAEQFDMYTVAEHVETAAQVACLQRIGVDCLQGYYYGAPTVRPAWRQGDPDQRLA